MTETEINLAKTERIKWVIRVARPHYNSPVHVHWCGYWLLVLLALLHSSGCWRAVAFPALKMAVGGTG